MGLRYTGYEKSRSEPNIVVDGSPNERTVLTLSHWPGYPVPASIAADLSTEIAFNFLNSPIDHPPATVVTSDHFDQDGLASIYVMVEPETALANRDLLIGLARAGDFATYTNRRAARASMVLSRLAEREMSAEYSQHTEELYKETLPIVVPMLNDPEPYRDLWADEDTRLSESEEAVATGLVTIAEHDDLDLAVIDIPSDFEARSGHRFGGQRFEGLHPMAIHNATDCFRLLLVHGRRFRYVDRYETWIQYRSRRPRPRVDLRPLSELLTSIERRSEVWTATGPGSLTPQLSHTGESSIPAGQLVGLVSRHLRSQPPAWDPYSADAA